MSSISAKRASAKTAVEEPRSKLHEAIAAYNAATSKQNIALGATAPVSNVLRDLNMESDRVTRFRNMQAHESPDMFIKEKKLSHGNAD